MRRAIIGLLISIVSFLGFGTTVFAALSWTAEISSPPSTVTTKNFNVQFTTLSTDNSDTIDLTLKQNGTSIGTKSVNGGNSGVFPVTVSSDGTYSYTLDATNSSGGTNSGTRTSATVKVDTTPPPAPIYLGSTKNGNTYTLKFKNPSNETVTISVYSSTSKTFTANSSTLVGIVNVGPGQTKTFSYTAPDSQQRYNAVQSTDSSGNTSTSLTGDSEVVAAPASTGDDTTTNNTTTQTTAQDTSQEGQVQAAETDKNARELADLNRSTNTNAAVVVKPNTTRNYIIASVLGLAIVGGYFLYRNSKNKKQNSDTTSKSSKS